MWHCSQRGLWMSAPSQQGDARRTCPRDCTTKTLVYLRKCLHIATTRGPLPKMLPTEARRELGATATSAWLHLAAVSLHLHQPPTEAQDLPWGVRQPAVSALLLARGCDGRRVTKGKQSRYRLTGRWLTTYRFLRPHGEVAHNLPPHGGLRGPERIAHPTAFPGPERIAHPTACRPPPRQVGLLTGETHLTAMKQRRERVHCSPCSPLQQRFRQDSKGTLEAIPPATRKSRR